MNEYFSEVIWFDLVFPITSIWWLQVPPAGHKKYRNILIKFLWFYFPLRLFCQITDILPIYSRAFLTCDWVVLVFYGLGMGFCLVLNSIWQTIDINWSYRKLCVIPSIILLTLPCSLCRVTLKLLILPSELFWNFMEICWSSGWTQLVEYFLYSQLKSVE